MRNIKSVCVYCGSSSRVDQLYKDAADRLGKIIAGQGWTMVYGGGSAGLMGISAQAALSAGGKVVGIIPEHIRARELLLDNLTEFYVVDSMHERKQMMAERSDAFVVLPGGLGTLDELFEILTWRQLHLHDKPVIVINVANYWDRLAALADHIASVGFMKTEDRNLFRMVGGVEDVVGALAEAPETIIETEAKWM